MEIDFDYTLTPKMRQRRWEGECEFGRLHSQLDEFQQREVWVRGERRRLVLCSWCGTWTESRNLDQDMLETWSPDAKQFWREKHPR
jgi:hypothetical protein